jgi:hypothetical protein
MYQTTGYAQMHALFFLVRPAWAQSYGKAPKGVRQMAKETVTFMLLETVEEDKNET